MYKPYSFPLDNGTFFTIIKSIDWWSDDWGNLLFLSYLVLWFFAPQWFQMVSGYIKLAYYYYYVLRGRYLFPSLLLFISWEFRFKDLKGALGCANNNMLSSCNPLLFPSLVNISPIVKSTTEPLLNSFVLLFLWEKCIDDFKSGSDVAGVAKSLLILRNERITFIWKVLILQHIIKAVKFSTSPCKNLFFLTKSLSQIVSEWSFI